MQHQNDWYPQCGMNAIQNYPKHVTYDFATLETSICSGNLKLYAFWCSMFNCFGFWKEGLTQTYVLHVFSCKSVSWSPWLWHSVALALYLEAGHLSRLQQWDDRANLCNASGFEYGLLGYSPRCTVFEISPIHIWTCWDDTNLDPNPKQSRIGRIDSFLQVCNQQSKK